MLDIEQAREVFSQDLYATEATGIEIDAVGENYAKCSLKLSRKHKNAAGHIMGGVMFTLADFTFAVATNATRPITVTSVSQISFLNSPKGDTLYSESKLLKDGRSTCFYCIDITDNVGTKVASVSITGAHISKAAVVPDR